MNTFFHTLRRLESCIGMVWLMGFLAVLYPGRAHAQDGGRYDVVLQGIPMETALQQLLTKTDINLAFDQNLVTDKWVYCVAEQSTAEEALRCILKDTGLDFYRLSSGLYVLTEAPETRPRFGTLQGIVVDEATGEPLPYAHILLADGSIGTVSNEAGRFQIAHLQPGYHRIATSYVGYHNRIDSVWVSPDATARTRLALQAEPFMTTPIIVDGMQGRHPSDSLGTTMLGQSSLLRVPNGGLPDIARSLNSLVGVRLSDATADLHLQGGETGEHQFQLDGAPVFIPISVGGLVGPFSPFAIGRVTVHKTGFGADLGSQSTGVIQAEHALGQVGTRSLDAQVDPMSINARLGFDVGTPGRTTGAFMLAGRTGLWDVYAPPPVRRLLEDWNRTDPFMLAAFRAIPQASLSTTPFFRQNLSTGNPGVGFVDLHAAARIRFGALRSLHLSSYLGRRSLDSDRDPFTPRTAAAEGTDAGYALDVEPHTRDRYVWNNSTSQIRYEAVLGRHVFASVQGRASLYKLRHDIVLDPLPTATPTDGETADEAYTYDPRDDNGNRIEEYAVGARLDAALLDRWHVETSVEPTYTYSRFFVQGTHPVPISHETEGWRVASFFNNRLTLSPRTTLEAGSRFTFLASSQTVYFEPRLAVRYDQPGGLLGPWSARVATGLYRQFVNQFDVSSRSARALSATSRMWLGLDDTVSPPHTAHLAGEWLFMPGKGWTARLEGYYKHHLHLLAVDYAAETPSLSDLGIDEEDNLSTFEPAVGYERALADRGLPLPSSGQHTFLADGKGYAYGGAVLVERKREHTRFEVRYEYSRARRSFGSFYNGTTIPTPWNEPHRLELAFDWRPFDALTILGRWHGIWGRAWGFRQSYYDFLGAYQERLIAAARQNTPTEDADFVLFNVQDIVDHVIAYRLQHPQDHHLPPVYQFDASIAYTQRVGGARVQTRLDLLNVFNRDNVADWRFAFDPNAYQRTELLQKEARLLLPFTPSLALRLSW